MNQDAGCQAPDIVLTKLEEMQPVINPIAPTDVTMAVSGLCLKEGLQRLQTRCKKPSHEADAVERKVSNAGCPLDQNCIAHQLMHSP